MHRSSRSRPSLAPSCTAHSTAGKVQGSWPLRRRHAARGRVCSRSCVGHEATSGCYSAGCLASKGQSLYGKQHTGKQLDVQGHPGRDESNDLENFAPDRIGAGRQYGRRVSLADFRHGKAVSGVLHADSVTDEAVALRLRSLHSEPLHPLCPGLPCYPLPGCCTARSPC